MATGQGGGSEEALRELLEGQELCVLSVAFCADQRGAAYVRLAPPPLSWLKTEASNQVAALRGRPRSHLDSHPGSVHRYLGPLGLCRRRQRHARG